MMYEDNKSIAMDTVHVDARCVCMLARLTRVLAECFA